MPTSLLPVPECVNTDSYGLCKPDLSETNEAAQSGDVLTRLKITLHQPLAHPCRNGSTELFWGQFANIIHCQFSMYDL